MAIPPESIGTYAQLATTEETAPSNDESIAVCSLPFELDTLRSNQLSQVSRNQIPPISDPNPDQGEQFLNAATVIEWASSNLNFSVSLCQLEFGYNGSPTAPLCLLVLAFSFHTSNTRKRITQATVDITFEDQGPLQNDSAHTQTQSSNHFGIVDLAPRNQQGTPLTVPTATTIQSSVGPIGAGVMLGATVSNQQTSSARICGTPRMGRPLGREAHFTLSENTLTRGGIPTEVKCAILLRTAPNRKYAAKVMANAKINQWIFRTRASREATIHFEPVSDAGSEGIGFDLDPRQRNTGRVIGGKVRIGDVLYGPQRQTISNLSELVPELQQGEPSGLEGWTHVSW
ncbi:MAG: hypothetical protein M1813_001623 [Trichoglossum hirsutum]|nr:MAG: hypothetical protein M1813_001623 [Trichoglossum hirsutum]